MYSLLAITTTYRLYLNIFTNNHSHIILTTAVANIYYTVMVIVDRNHIAICENDYIRALCDNYYMQQACIHFLVYHKIGMVVITNFDSTVMIAVQEIQLAVCLNDHTQAVCTNYEPPPVCHHSNVQPCEHWSWRFVLNYQISCKYLLHALLFGSFLMVPLTVLPGSTSKKPACRLKPFCIILMAINFGCEEPLEDQIRRTTCKWIDLFSLAAIQTPLFLSHYHYLPFRFLFAFIQFSLLKSNLSFCFFQS